VTPPVEKLLNVYISIGYKTDPSGDGSNYPVIEPQRHEKTISSAPCCPKQNAMLMPNISQVFISLDGTNIVLSWYAQFSPVLNLQYAALPVTYGGPEKSEAVHRKHDCS
jgi:hypothetical protein